MTNRKDFLLLLLIILFASFIRFYRVYDLAVFLADQASDSTKVLNILHGKFTLLGPITSVGGFYNGPIVYYLMLSFYWLFKADPVSGTIFQSTFSIITIPFIFLIGKKIKNSQVGYLASFLFSVSPLIVEYSRAAFNSYPAIFFSTLILYLFLKVNEKVSFLLVLILGILIGFIVQMHYFAISFLMLTLFYPLFLNKKLISLKYYLSLLAGFLIGISPFLIFELRHKFLNITMFVKYMISSKESAKSMVNILQIWPEVTGRLLFANNYFLGLLGFIITSATTAYLFIKKRLQTLSIFIFLFLIVFAIGLIYGRKMETHYIISFHTSLIILFALGVNYLLKEKKLFMIFLFFLILLINATSWNLDKTKHPLQDGLSISDFKKAASIIKNDNKNIYNVAMHAQGDNRAMPLRYTLNLLGEEPVGYENYSRVENLYFIIRKEEPVGSLKMWEYTSFGPSKVTKKWELNNEYFLYKFAKK